MGFCFIRMNIPKLYELFRKHPEICTDSRKIVKGSIFFALKGENFNGNKFAEKAVNNGCAFAVIDEKKFSINKNFILVEDVLQTLQELAKYHREQLTIPVIAITGTNGKTTSKELINAVLSKELNVAATKENLNNHIGWLLYDKPGGHIFFNNRFNKKEINQYNNILIKNEDTDTIYSISKN